MPHTEKPSHCYSIGLNCQDCVAGSALQLAMVCGRIADGDLSRIFLKMYDDPACHRMASEFRGVYRASTARGGAVGESVVDLEPATAAVSWIFPAATEPVPA